VANAGARRANMAPHNAAGRLFREAVSCYQTEAVYGLRAVFYSVLLRRFAMLNLDEDAILVSAGAS